MIALALTVVLCAQDLPAAPEGLQVREVVKLGPPDENFRPVRVQPHPKTGLLYVLYTNGDLWQVDVEKSAKKKVLEGRKYFRPEAPPFVQALGFHIDAAGLAYIVVNERHDNDRPKRAHVSIYRVADTDGDGVPAKATEWFAYDHPWGIGPFNHGACHLATGPDGMIYLSIGSRTDHGEPGKKPEETHLATWGETGLTACLVRLDPKESPPTPEVWARGLRNSFGFDWDDQGRIVATENGPDADHPEELNWLQKGKHYGFPYRFGNLALPMYPDAVPAPEGLTFEKPIANLGPAARPGAAKEYTFDPHCSPAGMTFYRKGTLPSKYVGGFFVTRFGNFLGKVPVGFDLLHVRLVEKDGELAADIQPILEKLRRPIDVCQATGKLYVLEHTTYDSSRLSRLLELSGK